MSLGDKEGMDWEGSQGDPKQKQYRLWKGIVQDVRS